MLVKHFVMPVPVSLANHQSLSVRNVSAIILMKAKGKLGIAVILMKIVHRVIATMNRVLRVTTTLASSTQVQLQQAPAVRQGWQVVILVLVVEVITNKTVRKEGARDVTHLRLNINIGRGIQLVVGVVSFMYLIKKMLRVVL